MKARLHAFLHPEYREKTAEIILSDRFKDEDGTVVPFIVKSINQEENTLLIKKCTPPGTDKNGNEKPVNKILYQNAMIVECCVQPDFKDAEVCSAYGVVNPLDVPSKMLLAGEFGRLATFIMETCGFKAGEEVHEEAKNSSTATTQSPNLQPTCSSTTDGAQIELTKNQNEALF